MQNTESSSLSTLHVSELARLADVTPATVRYYSRIGLLSPSREPENGYRCFSPADRRRVAFIRRAQSLGLTIGDIKILLESVDQGDTPCHRVRTLVEERLQAVQNQVAKLKATEHRITHALTTWDGMDEQTPTKGELCPLIDRVNLSMPPLAGSHSDSVSPHRPYGPSSDNEAAAVGHC